MLCPHHDDAEKDGRSGDADPGVPALATTGPAEERGEPDQTATGDDDVTDPVEPSQFPQLDPNRVYDLPHVDRTADVVALLVGHTCATLEIVGEMTGRTLDANELIAAIRTKFGR